MKPGHKWHPTLLIIISKSPSNLCSFLEYNQVVWLDPSSCTLTDYRHYMHLCTRYSRGLGHGPQATNILRSDLRHYILVEIFSFNNCVMLLSSHSDILTSWYDFKLIVTSKNILFVDIKLSTKFYCFICNCSQDIKPELGYMRIPSGLYLVLSLVIRRGLSDVRRASGLI